MILLSEQDDEEKPDGNLRSLFGKLLALVYQCYDRIVIQGYLPRLSREAHIVYFFRDVPAAHSRSSLWRPVPCSRSAQPPRGEFPPGR